MKCPALGKLLALLHISGSPTFWGYGKNKWTEREFKNDNPKYGIVILLFAQQASGTLSSSAGAWVPAPGMQSGFIHQEK